MAKPRFLLVVFPAQVHVNPALQLAKRLILIGCEVTFVTTIHAHRRMITKGGSGGGNNDNNNFTPPNGMSFAAFSDGDDEGLGPKQGVYTIYGSEIRRRGTQALKDLVQSGQNEGRPYTCMVYTHVMPWAMDVAAELEIPVALFWVQTATVFDVCYYYFHGYGDLVRDKYNNKDYSCSLTFPGLPLDLTVPDLPSIFDLSGFSSKVPSLIKGFQAQFDVIDRERQRPKILVNTFDALEPEALRAISTNKLNLIGVGPLFDPIDLRQSDDNKSMISEWLDSKPKGSVIYVSFGSIAVLSKLQMEEIAKGLLDFGRPFLWIIREINDNKTEEEEEEKLSCRGELEKLGIIVPWCCQVEVLCNKALGCFVTHGGWNSTLESLVCGVPVVVFPQFVDQTTNAKLIEDLWKTGVRVKANEEGVVGAEEIKRCNIGRRWNEKECQEMEGFSYGSFQGRWVIRLEP
ncbi:hypothetical protein TIFTF001_046402 [Ficus carica]|uniref:Glycosyltransferase n=1 Tax=Ficus carica TaxID=3494 RepID=A0AA87ZP19_FICCA|nr:hypothetical protein TIFTF001_046402 [Ficus carica]